MNTALIMRGISRRFGRRAARLNTPVVAASPGEAAKVLAVTDPKYAATRGQQNMSHTFPSPTGLEVQHA